jgi:hypothetical protein
MEKNEKFNKTLKNLKHRYEKYIKYINSRAYKQKPNASHGYCFGSKFTAKMFIFVLIVINIIAIIVSFSSQSFYWLHVVLILAYLAFHVIIIQQIQLNWSEANCIEKTKAIYADKFSLSTQASDNSTVYLVNYEIVTPITGTLKQQATLSQSTYEFLLTQDKLPVVLNYGVGFEYSIDFDKIKQLIKNK